MLDGDKNAYQNQPRSWHNALQLVSGAFADTFYSPLILKFPFRFPNGFFLSDYEYYFAAKEGAVAGLEFAIKVASEKGVVSAKALENGISNLGCCRDISYLDLEERRHGSVRERTTF